MRTATWCALLVTAALCGCSTPEGTATRAHSTGSASQALSGANAQAATDPVVAGPGLGISSTALDQIQALALEKRSRTAAQKKLASQLIIAAKLRRGDPQLGPLSALPRGVKLSASGTVRVDIKADVDSALLGRVVTLGGQVVASVPRFHAVQADLPLDALEILAGDAQVHSILPALGMVTRKVNTSEGDVAHKADVARSAHSLSGNGITVGVISDGVDSMAARQTSGDLPNSPQLSVLTGQAGSGDEGTAMMEIVHDLAPDAKLIFATGAPSPAQMAQNILDLRTAGADIIVDDIGYLNEGAFEDDIIVDAVDQVTSAGALYFSAAGNDGNKADGTASGYEGDYAAAAPPATLPTLTTSGWLDVNDFGGGAKANAITKDPPGMIVLQWSDPIGGSANDYDLFLLNSSLSSVVDSSTGTQDGTQDPIEFIDSGTRNDVNRQLLVARVSGATRMIHLSTYGGVVSQQSTGEIFGHAAAANAFAVGAVDVGTASGGPFVGGATNPFESFSSDGPRRIFYDKTGVAITPGNFLSGGGTLRQKPDLSAADGVATATPGFNPFHGTSAAAPHVAAMAALLLESRPDLVALGDASAAAAVRAMLLPASLDIGAAGADIDSGSGILMADKLLTPCVGNGTSCDDGNACTQTDTCQAGICTGSSPVTCTPSDQCHLSACNIGTGLCQESTVADSTACDDGDGCTQADTCQGGVCVGSNPVSCAAADQCHVAACNAATGMCETTNAANGLPCNDANRCTLVDSCQNGICTGMAVVCAALDPCHTAGTCDPNTGVCSNPLASDGTPCATGICSAGACVVASQMDAGGETAVDSGSAGGAVSVAGSSAGAGVGGAAGLSTTRSHGVIGGAGGSNSSAGGRGATPDFRGACSCRLPGASSKSGSGPLLVGLGALLLVARRRRAGASSGHEIR